MGVLLGHADHLLCVKHVVLGCNASIATTLATVIVAVMPWDPGTGVFGVEDGVDDELAHVVVLQAVEDRRAVPTGAHQASHPQLGEVLGDRRCRFADMLGEFVDRHFAVGQGPQHLHAGGVGQHPEHSRPTRLT